MFNSTHPAPHNPRWTRTVKLFCAVAGLRDGAGGGEGRGAGNGAEPERGLPPRAATRAASPLRPAGPRVGGAGQSRAGSLRCLLGGGVRAGARGVARLHQGDYKSRRPARSPGCPAPAPARPAPWRSSAGWRGGCGARAGGGCGAPRVRGSSGPSRRVVGPAGHLSRREMSSVAASMVSSVKWGGPALDRGGGARLGWWGGRSWGWGTGLGKGALWEELWVGGERGGVCR